MFQECFAAATRWKLVALLLLLSIPSFNGGIPGLTKFFRSNYKPAWCLHDKKAESMEAMHLAIEMNPILHMNMRAAKNPTHYISKIFCTLDKILTMVKPTKSLILVFDGPAPFAKVITCLTFKRIVLVHTQLIGIHHNIPFLDCNINLCPTNCVRCKLSGTDE